MPDYKFLEAFREISKVLKQMTAVFFPTYALEELAVFHIVDLFLIISLHIAKIVTIAGETSANILLKKF